MIEEKTTIDLTKLKDGYPLTWRRESKYLEQKHGDSTFVRIASPASSNFNAILIIKNKYGKEVRIGSNHFEFEE